MNIHALYAEQFPGHFLKASSFPALPAEGYSGIRTPCLRRTQNAHDMKNIKTARKIPAIAHLFLLSLRR